ncbi:hypothetical protein [Clostridium sp. SM-530-WT-3G]|uniref:hypothetical protein n=1 Tax=Clostridium sp. SM-530-WT-3G TaxID=2725303 RepID=UPI00145D6378|nr:hypothetical protein [Clostridium sp. SM-530-WT-3G]NME81604.1 hypothetical protein [Clostridium sp. SM-530-WT-3G]
MGILSNIGSALSSVGSAICSGISSACSAIGGALFSGASGIASLATGIVSPLIGLGLPEILIGIKVIGGIISTIAEMLGLKDKEETPEELGMKAEEAERKPEQFESTEKYIEYLRNEVQIDKEKLENLSDEDKVKYAAIGSSIYVKGMEEKYGMNMPADFWRTVADLKMDGQEVKAYIDNFKKHNITDMSDMTNYIKRDLDDGKDRGAISDAMIDSLKELNPDATREELYEKLISLNDE